MFPPTTIFQLYKGMNTLCVQYKPNSKFWFLIFSLVSTCGTIFSHNAGQYTLQWTVLPDDFAQLEANVSVLNMFKVGEAKLWY